MKKLNNTKAELKKSDAYKKACDHGIISMQFVIFKPLSYCFEETIGFDVKASFTSRPVSRLISWYNNQVIQQKNFDKRLFSPTGLFTDWKSQTAWYISWVFFHNCLPLEFLFTYDISLMGRMWWEISIYTRADKKKIKSSKKEYVTGTCFKFWPMKNIFRKQ